MSYTEFTTLPDNVAYFDPDSDRDPKKNPDKLFWSSTHAVPAIGAELYVHITLWDPEAREHQAFKWGRVEGYFQEHGFFGLLMTFKDPPRSWRYHTGHIFGIDIDWERQP